MLLNRIVYSLTGEMYLAGCELHVRTLPFLVLTLKQYVNAKTIWRSKVWNVNHRDDHCQPLMTYAAFSPAHFWSFSGEAGYFLEPSLHFTPRLQSSVCILPLVCVSSLVCGWQSAFHNDGIFKQIEIFPKQVWIRFSVESGGNWEKPCPA